MMKTRLTGMILAIILVLMTFEACGSANTEPTEQSLPKSNIYRLEDYESDEVFDIQTVELSESLAARCKSYKFTYLSDGLKIKGYISIPASAQISQKPCKCVLYNRGGNRDYGTLEDDTTAQFCAASGRIVIASQYREADGALGYDQFGGDDLHDVIKLIDICENHFSFVDMDDFCVFGASRGGMMTYMAARQDDRIKLIISLSGVSDLFNSYESREDMKRVLEETIGCTPEENPAEYEKRSAVYWADEINIPVLIIHSKLDQQVPFEQAEEMVEKLKDHTDCTFITHEDDVHGPHNEDIAIINNWLKEHETTK
ncbi:MAG: S9 family peptidase [Ruminococcus sp.]|nr:S9 family peptidase [Ruminococcus sp.]